VPRTKASTTIIGIPQHRHTKVGNIEPVMVPSVIVADLEHGD